MKYPLGCALAAMLACTAAPASAHHSAAMFDHKHVVVLTGTLKSISYQAPHSWISIIGGPEGATEAQQWDAETGTPAILSVMGVNHDTLKPGDRVTLGIYPLRDGRRAGALIYIVTADGHVYGSKPTRASD